MTPLKPRVIPVLDQFPVHLQEGNTECNNKLYLDTKIQSKTLFSGVDNSS